MKKFKKLLFVLPIFLVCFTVSVSANSTEVQIGNLTFLNPSFRTYVGSGYSEPSSSVITNFFDQSSGSGSITEITYDGNGEWFGGSSSYYRCMRAQVILPANGSAKKFYVTVTPYAIDSRGNSTVRDLDISLGDLTYFSNGGISDNPFLTYSATREGKSIKFVVDLGTLDTFYFQFATLIYGEWTDYRLTFSGMSLVSEDGSKIIINNQNQNTQNILNNQNENADKIIGSLGGNDDYNAPGSGDLGNLEDSESALINGNKVQSDEANNRINDNVLGSIQRLASSFGATASMFQDMGLKLPDLSVLLYFSLILGIVPIIVGLSINNLRGHDAKVVRERSRNDYKRGYNAGYTKGKGG